MTRNFNNQRREDERRDSRSSSPRRYGEERSPRPARPRLNRDMVDRAWENGARQNHADYRTRGDNNNQPPRDNRQRNQYSDQSPAQNSRNYRKPYGNRQGSYRPGEPTPRSNYGPRPRTYESGMRTFNEQRYNENERRGYSDRPDQAGYRPDSRQSAQHPNSRSPYRDQNQYQGPQRREFDRDTRQPRSFDRDQRQGRDFDRDSRQPRSYDRNKRSSRNDTGPDTQNPRWQSRPARQRSNYSSRPREFARRGADQELFEGDYEHFDADNSAQLHTNQVRDTVHTPQQAEERHVTHLPDGRVLKGTPHEQRRDAEFWTEIAQESNELVQPVEVLPEVVAVAEHSEDLPTAAPTKGKPRSRTQTASAATRDRKTKVRKSTPKPRSTGPKPSQRGYKWPTPDE
ncbi:MAG TPA: hypothetical protein VF844_03965 [Ktedonobacteraceae bacterium]